MNYEIKEVTPTYTYVVFTNNTGATVGQMFTGSEQPSEAEILAKGEALIPDTKVPTLDDIKAAKIDEINFWRQVTLDSGFVFEGNRIDSDTTSRANIVGEALSAQMGEGFPQGYTWRTQDNRNVAMTGADVQNMARALRIFTLTAYATSWALKDAVMACTTAEQVAAIPSH